MASKRSASPRASGKEPKHQRPLQLMSTEEKIDVIVMLRERRSHGEVAAHYCMTESAVACIETEYEQAFTRFAPVTIQITFQNFVSALYFYYLYFQLLGTKVAAYNRIRFLTDALGDLDSYFRKQGSQLHVFKGDPVEIFRMLHKNCGMSRLTFEQHVSSLLGLPPRPSPYPDWTDVFFGEITDGLAGKLGLCPKIPTPEELGFFQECDEACPYVGGETAALKHLEERLRVEEDAFRDGYILPNQVNPDILGPPMSMSAALRFGCLSVRKFFWEVQEVYFKLHKGLPPPSHSLTAQLIWREFFYCMSAKNPKYDKMKGNPICIDIPWYEDEEHFNAWKDGRTGYPFIDASMRQLRKEGWIHHVCRTAVACFLTRGDLWISWEKGLQVFLKYLIDADWSVSAGNWMWVSSSAFERQLDCSTCICPVNYGRRVEPTGDYIRRYVPEIANFPQEYIFEPWLAPLAIQKKYNCIIGKDYPERVVIHEVVSKENRKMMENISQRMKEAPPHCCPSNVKETRLFLRLPQSCFHNVL
ncbi:cryptochrome-1-like [Macrobrachium nipponense]|uniref:cryptochrome-1-like n=1 Tax=Macrobrachium nipponense TaxID=159736 RepID=UPI0030C84F6B